METKNERPNDMTRERYNRMVAEAGFKAARWAINDDRDVQEYTGEAMRHVFDNGVEEHRESILQYAAWLPDFEDTADVHDVENTSDLLNALAQEAVREDIYGIAWRAQEFYETVRQDQAAVPEAEEQASAK